ncbi:hypothetical protein [Parageobacillus sp. VR-IP]|nr:hypothetical protein [Parageobacillus sp. VR-IP]
MEAKAGEFYLTYGELKEIGIIWPTSVFILSTKNGKRANIVRN